MICNSVTTKFYRDSYIVIEEEQKMRVNIVIQIFSLCQLLNALILEQYVCSILCSVPFFRPKANIKTSIKIFENKIWSKDPQTQAYYEHPKGC
jgi:hypothetical protein